MFAILCTCVRIVLFLGSGLGLIGEADGVDRVNSIVLARQQEASYRSAQLVRSAPQRESITSLYCSADMSWHSVVFFPSTGAGLAGGVHAWLRGGTVSELV